MIDELTFHARPRRKPTRRQILFNWFMGEPDFATKHDGWWGGSEDVARIDALLQALDAARDVPAQPEGQ